MDASTEVECRGFTPNPLAKRLTCAPGLSCMEGGAQNSVLHAFLQSFIKPSGQVARKDNVEQFHELEHLLRVRMLRTMMVALLVLAWVPLTSHCELESVPGFEFLRCSSEVPATSEGGDPCKSGGCCSVEVAQYQSPRQQEVIPVCVAAILPAEPFIDVEQSLPPEVSLGILTAAPPELPVSWQFLLRTALPVRAPSPAS